MDHDPKVPADILMQLDDVHLITDLARISVVMHETRHFHDFLLYPLGAVVLRERVFAATNGLRVVAALREMVRDGQVIPLPLHEWLTLSPQDRDLFAARNLNRGGRTGESFPDLPVLDANDFLQDIPRGVPINVHGEQYLRTACRLAQASHAQVQALWRAPHDRTGPAPAGAIDLWETSGLLCQHRHVARAAGEQCSVRFMTAVVEQIPSYRHGLDLLMGILGDQTAKRMNSRLWGALVAWSQMGRFKDESQRSSPLHRLIRLGEALQRGMRWNAEDPFVDLVRHWDACVESDSFDALDDSTRELGLLADRLEIRTKQHGPGPSGVDAAAARQVRNFQQAHLTMKESFLADPDGYVDNDTYVNQADRFPAPAVAVSLPMSSDRGPLEEWFDATPSGVTPAIPYDTAMEFANYVLATDALFLSSKKTRQQHTKELVERFLGWRTVALIRE